MLSFNSPVQTVWHKVPVGWKFLLVCFASIFLFVFDSLYIQCIALLCCVLFYAVGGVSFIRIGAKKLLFLWPILLVIVVWHGVTGTAMQGIAFAIRLISIVALSNLMTMTSRLSDLLALIQTALTPVRALGFSTRALEIAIALVVRFTPVLIEKGSTLFDAWRLRAVKRVNWRIVLPMSLIAMDDAEHVAEALKARGGIRAFASSHERSHNTD